MLENLCYYQYTFVPTEGLPSDDELADALAQQLVIGKEIKKRIFLNNIV